MRVTVLAMLLTMLGALGCEDVPWCPDNRDIWGRKQDMVPCCAFWLWKNQGWCSDWFCTPAWNCVDGRFGSTGSDAGVNIADMCGGGSDAAVCAATASTATITDLEYRLQQEVAVTCRKGSVDGTTTLTLRYNDFSPDGFIAQIGQYVPQEIKYTEWTDAKGTFRFRANIAVVRKVIGKPITHLGSTYSTTEWFCNMDPAVAWIKTNMPNGL